MFFALELKTFGFLSVWIGRKKKLPSCKRAAMNFWHHLELTQYERDEGYLSRPGVDGCTWKNLSLDLLARVRGRMGTE